MGGTALGSVLMRWFHALRRQVERHPFASDAPLAVAAVVMGALVVESLSVGSAPTPDTPLVGWLLAIYSVAAHCDRVAALTGRCVQPRRRPCLDRRRRRPLSSRGLWQRLGRGTSRPPTPPVRARP